MRLSLFEIYSYRFPTREGLLVRLRNELGREGVGEIAPLPGRSKESLEEALTATKQIRERLFQKDLSETQLPPSVLFGMEMAMLNLLSPLTESRPFKITYLSNEPTHHTLKVKLSDTPDPVTLCKRLLESRAKIHIDLNRKWDLKETLAFCKHFKPGDFTYIEDPVKEFDDLEQFYQETGFAYAIDEHFHSLDTVLSLQGLTHLIIKPTLFGGLSQCQEIVKRAVGKTSVFSSANETAVGLMHIARIGTTLNPGEPLGIDTPPHFAFFNPKSGLLPHHFMPIPWGQLEKL